jgi:hypothetical protein
MKALSRQDASAEAALGGGPGGPAAERMPLRELMDDRLLDALLERSRDEAGGLRLTDEGSMLGEAAHVPQPVGDRLRATAVRLREHAGKHDRTRITTGKDAG